MSLHPVTVVSKRVIGPLYDSSCSSSSSIQFPPQSSHTLLTMPSQLIHKVHGLIFNH